VPSCWISPSLEPNSSMNPAARLDRPRRLQRASRLGGVVVLAVLTAGCGRSPSTPGIDTPTPAPAQKSPERPTNAAVDFDDPARSVAHFLTSLALGQSDAVVSSLPERYRRDLDRWLTETVAPLDAGVRQDAAAALARLAETLEHKREFVLASDRFELEGPAAAFAREHFAFVCRAITALARWPGWWDDGDAEELIRHLANSAAADDSFVQAFQAIRVENVSRDGERAVVELRTSDREPFRLSLIQIERRWVPAAFAERWEAFFTNTTGSPSEREQR
jgi:hypothetical protein